MINVKSFLKQSSVYTISTFLSRAITLLLIPVYAKFLTPADYGAVDIVSVTCTLINLTIALEIHQAIARFYNEWHEKARVVNISTAFLFSLLVYTIFILILYPIRSRLAGYFFEDQSKTVEMNAALLMVWSSGIYYFTQSQLRWQMLIWNHAIVTICFTTVTGLLTVYLIAFKGLAMLGVLYGLVGGNLVGIILSVYFTRMSYGRYFSPSRLKQMLSFSIPLVVSGISVFLSLYVDRLMIKHYLDLDDLGIFSMGSKFASIVGLLLVGVNNALSPLIYKHYKEPETPAQIEKIFHFFILAGLLMFLGLSLFAHEILLVFTTTDYLGAQNIIPFLVISTLLSAMYNFTPGIFIGKKTKLILYINLATALVNLFLNFCLIRYFGIIGSCIATMISAVFNFILYLHFNKIYYPINFKWWSKIKMLLAALGLFSVFLLVRLDGMILSIAFKSILILLFGILCFYQLKGSTLQTTK